MLLSAHHSIGYYFRPKLATASFFLLRIGVGHVVLYCAQRVIAFANLGVDVDVRVRACVRACVLFQLRHHATFRDIGEVQIRWRDDGTVGWQSEEVRPCVCFKPHRVIIYIYTHV